MTTENEHDYRGIVVKLKIIKQIDLCETNFVYNRIVLKNDTVLLVNNCCLSLNNDELWIEK